jgi:hypothetical protein
LSFKGIHTQHTRKRKKRGQTNYIRSTNSSIRLTPWYSIYILYFVLFFCLCQNSDHVDKFVKRIK